MSEIRGITNEEALNLLGGVKKRSRKHHVLNNGDSISLKYSKFYPDRQYYWFAFSPNALDNFETIGLTHVGLILESKGVLQLPFELLQKYITNADTSKKQEEISHYHVRVKHDDDDLILYNSAETFRVSDYLVTKDQRTLFLR